VEPDRPVADEFAIVAGDARDVALAAAKRDHVFAAGGPDRLHDIGRRRLLGIEIDEPAHSAACSTAIARPSPTAAPARPRSLRRPARSSRRTSPA
jgi:hypothetical protein